MLKKAESLYKYLAEQNIGNFNVQELDNEQQSVIFQSTFPLDKNLMPVGIIVDTTIFTIIRIKLVENLLDDRNILEAYRCITKANGRNKIAKYYITPDMTIYVDACIPQEEPVFSPKLVVDILHLMLQNIRQELPILLEML